MVYTELPSGVEKVFSWQSPAWNEEFFAREGGFVAVVLNYNKLPYIADACLSALDQDFGCYEVVFMDDASSDGSFEVMESVVKGFIKSYNDNTDSRAIKVSVLHNTINQSTLGQWSIAVSVSSGTWFGMFCGDDVSLPKRIQDSRSVISMFPSAKAICTSGTASNGERIGDGDSILTWKGSNSKLPLPYWLGCTAFWHREVLEKSFGCHNMDDFVLFWSTIILTQDRDDVSLVWALDRETISYRVGTGVSTEDGKDARNSRSWIIRTWRVAAANKRFERKFGANTWKYILDFDKKYGRDSRVREQIKGFYRTAQMATYGWWRRWWVLFKVFVLERSNKYGGEYKVVRCMVLKRFLLQLLGPASAVAFLAPFEIRRRLKATYGK